MGHCLLSDRAIVAVSGEDAEGLLNRLFTRNLAGMDEGTGRYAALLSPQGKLLFDVFVARRADGFWIDCAREQADDLVKKLTMFRLRSKVVIERQEALGIAASWGGALLEAPGPAFRDPRHDQLGYRIVAPHARLRLFPDDASEYERHRVLLGIPKGGVDFVYGDAFVHDANLDLLHGVDFDKGCYVGQEVVSRVHHRNAARKRVVKVHVYGDAPPVGAALTAGPTQIGTLTSIVGHDGLASVRIDRLAEAEAAKQPVLAGETLVGITLPSMNDVRPAIHHAGS